MPLPNHLLKIERLLWTNDADVYERTLVEDAVPVLLKQALDWLQTNISARG